MPELLPAQLILILADEFFSHHIAQPALSLFVMLDLHKKRQQQCPRRRLAYSGELGPNLVEHESCRFSSLLAFSGGCNQFQQQIAKFKSNALRLCNKVLHTDAGGFRQDLGVAGKDRCRTVENTEQWIVRTAQAGSAQHFHKHGQHNLSLRAMKCAK